MRSVLSLLAVCALVAPTRARADAAHGHATRRTSAITVDGHLDEPAWAAAPKQSGFVQRFPKDGDAASQQTTFAVLYDDDAIYVGVWADDPEPAKIRALLTRRDMDAPADSVAIGIDSYNDRRTAFVFQLNAAGVQRDILVSDDSTMDDTWDAVWTGDTAITDHGWTAELRIPLGQLRFSAADAHTWGFQVVRNVGRTSEQTAWSPWSRAAPQIVSRFGVLDGIEPKTRGSRLELLPYALGGVSAVPVDAGDPVNDHIGLRRNAGLDLKYGLGSAFTLSATLNPDFGQVEADPSQINLSQNELFFAEKRPFFLEGMDLFRLGIGLDGDSDPQGAFYSRRIGAAPKEPDGDFAYTHLPTSTAIYGAAKLTGKTASGWSIGALDAVTGEERADVVGEDGSRGTPLVAPLTNYGVLRVKRDLRDGRTSVGASATAVDRALGGSPLAATMRDQAYTAGLTVQHRWGDDAWLADVRSVGSWVHGSMDAIAATQEDAVHYFQRPDASNLHFDPMRTSLAGAGMMWRIGRFGETKHWRSGFGGDLRTPGLELNDLGFQLGTQHQINWVYAEYREDEPSKHVLNYNFNGDVYDVTTLEPRLLGTGIEGNGTVQLANYWRVSTGVKVAFDRYDPDLLRGGPAMRQDPNLHGMLNVVSDPRKRVWFTARVGGHRNPTTDMIGIDTDVGATIQARSNIDLFVGPSWSERIEPLQYVDQVDDTAGQRHYLLARIHQTVGGLTVRMNWTFSPHLSLQAYAQPYVATGRYSELKDVGNPHAARYEDRFHVLSGSEYREQDGTIYATYGGGSYQLAKPDFSFAQLRSTVVMRWEWRPGSNVFAIWSHGVTDTTDDGRMRLGHDLSGLVHAASENIVMVKANYWFGL